MPPNFGVPYSHNLVATLIAEKDRPTPHSRSEKQRDAETAALVADGEEFRHQIAARKTAKDAAEKARLVGPRRKRTARHYEKLNKFLASRGLPPAKAPAATMQLPLPLPSPSVLEDFRSQAGRRNEPTPTFPAVSAQARPLPADDFAGELERIQGSQLVGFGEPGRGFDNNPRPQVFTPQGESRQDVVARARASGHFSRPGAFHTTGNQVVSWQEWAAWAPK